MIHIVHLFAVTFDCCLVVRLTVGLLELVTENSHLLVLEMGFVEAVRINYNSKGVDL